MTETYQFLLRVPFTYEPTRTEVASLARFIAKATGAAVVSRVQTIAPDYYEDNVCYFVTFSFKATRPQAARTLIPSRYPRDTEAVLFLTQDSDGTFLKNPCPVAQCFTMDEFTIYDWPEYFIPATASTNLRTA